MVLSRTRFAFLEKEVKAVFDIRDKEASVMIEKLRQFIHIDIDAIPHVMVSKQSYGRLTKFD